MKKGMETVEPIQPPADVPEILRGNWLALPNRDPVVTYIAKNLWDHPGQPTSWEVARLSQAAYIYRETTSRWTVATKFYAVKTGSSAEAYARREFERTQQARAANLSAGNIRAIEPLALWRGGLFLEFIDGLTLEGIIAVRSSRPGSLTNCLTSVAEFLATLHRHGLQPGVQPDFEPAVKYAHKVIDQLAKYGVLEHQPIATEGLMRLIDRWADLPAMSDFVPCLNHGDTTTTNFVFPDEDRVVVIDWERLQTGDPAFDLGRLMAEITHSIDRHGGNVAEAEAFVEHLVAAYRQALPDAWDTAALAKRARFYRASSTLRIARNGWIPRLDRATLVAQAMGLLVDGL